MKNVIKLFISVIITGIMFMFTSCNGETDKTINEEEFLIGKWVHYDYEYGYTEMITINENHTYTFTEYNDSKHEVEETYDGVWEYHNKKITFINYGYIEEYDENVEYHDIGLVSINFNSFELIYQDDNGGYDEIDGVIFKRLFNN